MSNQWGAVMTTVFLLSFCGLSVEIALTRVFAVVLRYHFAFLAIAIALCGLGLGGYFAHWLRARATQLLPWLPLAMAITTLFAAWFLAHILLPYFPTAFWLAGLVALLPFLCLGATFAFLFDRYSERSGRLYAADLAGAALAAGGVLVLLNLVGGLNALIFLAGLVGLTLLLLSGVLGSLRVVGALVAVGGIAFAIANRDYRLFDLAPVRDTRPEIVKPMLAELATGRSRRSRPGMHPPWS